MVRGAIDQWSKARRRAVAIPAPELRFPISSDRTKPRGAPRPDVALTLNNIAIFYEVAVKAGARLPIRGREPLPSLPIELPNRRVRRPAELN